ncbi:maleylpyruvate isomerase family mycothiol-dependent enzyme [Nonomuraea rhodomycinica]|uniref:Maleylpyruvate isomerase family mycothiol-dependent enzyme n=1 Tax=Nonomuraea rhodomycinica TaxID=1712872 RepID=A0A7Y6MBV4_9ACTN|nr:maleylpyruvate isomerase family mycothiol-dependent enzyme [Nonomuraea rhodomycinica]NUW42723.1 maleylpyruvate isomerase family mycothiol-dependent enzyme [Nonomuraea rhodomycinica]
MEPVDRLYLDALAADAEVPAGSLRPQLLAGARARRRPAAPTAAWARPYAGRVAAMDALLASAGDDDWSRVVVEGWNLQELVAHLAAKDGLLAAAVGAPVLGPPITASDALGRTADVQAHERARSPEQTRRDWRAQADALCRHLAALAPEAPATLDGMETAVRDHALARALETWIHADDAARAAGVRLPHPVPEHIHPTADLCARLLPWTMLLSGLDGAGRALHLTLTGPGGGEWHVPLGVADTGAREPQARITADVVEFCFLLGGRGEPESFAAELEGDLGLARDVLRAAPALSGP